MVELPRDLIVENILPRLPVKSLLRFKAVCKSWLSEISTPAFRNSHLKFSSSSPKFLVCFVVNTFPMLSLSPDESETIVNDFVELQCDQFPNISTYKFRRVVGACNGVVCLNFDSKDAFALWNPATNQYNAVPLNREADVDVEYADHAFSVKAVGFGYASSIQDFKILAMFNWGIRSGYCYVFSVNTGSWKRLSYLDEICITCYPTSMDDCMPLCIDDTLYWPNKNPETKSLVGIIGFDLVHDQIKKIQEVPWLYNYLWVDHIFMMNGCLSMCCHKDDNIFTNDVWMLKEQDGLETWSKMFSIDASALLFTGTGKYLVHHSGKLKLIDPDQESPHQLKNAGHSRIGSAIQGCNYVESLSSF